MTQEWSHISTSRYQDHVIAHVLGATALGYFFIADCACVLLDIALIWTIYTSGEMALMPQSVVISDLEAGEDVKSELLEDAERLHSGETESLARMIALPPNFLITDVKLYAHKGRRLVALEAEDKSFAFEGLPETGEIKAVMSEE
jgi:hypothetical protein